MRASIINAHACNSALHLFLQVQAFWSKKFFMRTNEPKFIEIKEPELLGAVANRFWSLILFCDCCMENRFLGSQTLLLKLVNLFQIKLVGYSSPPTVGKVQESTKQSSIWPYLLLRGTIAALWPLCLVKYVAKWFVFLAQNKSVAGWSQNKGIHNKWLQMELLRERSTGEEGHDYGLATWILLEGGSVGWHVQSKFFERKKGDVPAEPS